MTASYREYHCGNSCNECRGNCSQSCNVKTGSNRGHDYVVFDYDTNSRETAHADTVLAVRAVSPKTPDTSLSGASGLHLERVGDWIFAFEPERRLGPDKIDRFVDDVRNLLEYAEAFPQNVSSCISTCATFFDNHCVTTAGCSRPGSNSASKTAPMMPKRTTSPNCR